VEAVLVTIELETYFPCNDHDTGVVQDNQLRATFDQQLSNAIRTLLDPVGVLKVLLKVEESHYNSRCKPKQVSRHQCGQTGHYTKRCASKCTSPRLRESTEQDPRVTRSDINTITINCVSIVTIVRIK